MSAIIIDTRMFHDQNTMVTDYTNKRNKEELQRLKT